MRGIYPLIAGAGKLYPAELAGITLMLIGFLMAKKLTEAKK